VCDGIKEIPDDLFESKKKDRRKRGFCSSTRAT
jgi:hypothetical protein